MKCEHTLPPAKEIKCNPNLNWVNNTNKMNLIIELKLEYCVNALDHYNKYYKENKDVSYNKEHECIYYIIESEVMPTKGQVVSTHFGYMEVDFSVYDLCNSGDYLDKNRIVVEEL